MKILLYNPDNGVTRNFMPHLWMFLLQALTPPGHEVMLIDGNAQPMDEAQIAQYVRDQKIGLVGIGAMTRMIAKAYRMADAIRAVGVPVVMGGPHVTEVADEALGRDGGPRHADAVALGEADETWPQIVERCGARRAERNLCAGGCFGQRAQAFAEGLSGDSVGHDRSPPVQSCSQSRVPAAEESRRRLGNVSHHSGGVGTRLSLRMRVLHGDRILRRLHPLSHQRERRQRTAAAEGARTKRKGPDRGFLHRRQFRHQREAHQITAARHHRRQSPGALGGADQRQPAARRRTGAT